MFHADYFLEFGVVLRSIILSRPKKILPPPRELCGIILCWLHAYLYVIIMRTCQGCRRSTTTHGGLVIINVPGRVSADQTSELSSRPASPPIIKSAVRLVARDLGERDIDSSSSAVPSQQRAPHDSQH